MRRTAVFAFLAIPVVGVVALLAWIFLRAGPPIWQLEEVAASGLEFTHTTGASGDRHMAETIAGSVAWIDHDGDGLLDLYCVNGNASPEAPSPPGAGPRNRLFRNLGEGRFSDVTDAAGVGHRGYGCGVAVGDYDGDGDSDLFVANYGADVLYRNEGGRFVDVSEAAGVSLEPARPASARSWSTSAAFFDADGDGLLDLWICRYVALDPRRRCRSGTTPTHCSPSEFHGLPDRLLKNIGGGRFIDVSASAGIAIAGPRAGKSLGVLSLIHI